MSVLLISPKLDEIHKNKLEKLSDSWQLFTVFEQIHMHLHDRPHVDKHVLYVYFYRFVFLNHNHWEEAKKFH